MSELATSKLHGNGYSIPCLQGYKIDKNSIYPKEEWGKCPEKSPQSIAGHHTILFMEGEKYRKINLTIAAMTAAEN